MSIGRVWFVLAAVALAVAACSKGSLTGDGGVTGAGGQSGTGGFPGCSRANEYTNCTPDAGTPPFGPYDNSPCTLEGARCDGFSCNDSFGGSAWSSTCCAGKWRPFYTDVCPAPLQPGDPFACSDSISCAAYQTYCLSANADRTSELSDSCAPICVAGDCSCFCDNPEGCTFLPAGSTCPADSCTCGMGGARFPMAGNIVVRCAYLVPGSAGCYRDASLDGQCGAGTLAVMCEGPRQDLSASCTPLPDSVITAACGAEIHYYCCVS